MQIRLTPAVWAAILVFQGAFGTAIYLLARGDAATPAVAVAPAASSAGGSLAPPAGAAGSSGLESVRAFMDGPRAAPSEPRATSFSEIMRNADRAFTAKDYARAAEEYERAYALSPADTEVANNLGLVLHYLGRSQEAVAYLEAAAARDPGHQRVWLTLGFVQLGSDRVDAARQSLARARDIDPASQIGQAASEYLDKIR